MVVRGKTHDKTWEQKPIPRHLPTSNIRVKYEVETTKLLDRDKNTVKKAPR